MLGNIIKQKTKYEERKNQKMQQLDVYYQLLSQHVSGIIMPIFSRTKVLLLHLVYIGLVLSDMVGSPTTATNHIQQNQTNIHQMQ